jgi:hypothetical protein
MKYSDALLITSLHIILVITNQNAKSLSDTLERY